MLAEDFPEPRFWDLGPIRKQYDLYMHKDNYPTLKEDLKEVCKAIGDHLVDVLRKKREEEDERRRQAAAAQNA